MPNKFLEIALEANCTICTTECWGTIWDSSIIGDGVCSDDLNTPFCDYDGGDCCLPYIVKSCLYNCICHVDGLVHPTFERIKIVKMQRKDATVPIRLKNLFCKVVFLKIHRMK